MTRPGLCSITFRGLSPDEVLAVAVRAGVEGIEWGADGHVPPGATALAAALARRGRADGVEVVSYGSYLGMAPTAADEDATVAAVLDTAEALGAPMVRIWTELGVTPDAPAGDRARVTERTASFVDAIAARGLVAALEFHPFTLTHTAAGTNALIDAIGRPELRTHWQPDPSVPVDAALRELDAVRPRLAHLHVFAWGPGGIEERHALEAGAGLWRAAVARTAAADRFALCEYVRNDDPDQLVADVATLRGWLASV